MDGIYVIKRNGSKEQFDPVKIRSRIEYLAVGLDSSINIDKITQTVCNGFLNGISTSKLDELTAAECQACCYDHPDYGILASRIAVSDLHKNTPKTFSEFITKAFSFKDKYGNPTLIDEGVYEWIMENKNRIDSSIINDRDNIMSYFAFKTLEKIYLFKDNTPTRNIIERPQYNIMRMALGIHYRPKSEDGTQHADIEEALETYKLISKGYFTHASPTRMNSCTPKAQLASCFLLMMKSDSIEGIFETLAKCAYISKHAGGLGLAIHNVRATGSYIAGTNGLSNGIVPMLKMYEKAINYIDQGGKRKGSLAIYIEPWHNEIEDFLNLRREQGSDDMRTRDLFLALWVPDLFMKRVYANENWTLFCPNDVDNLWEYYGDEFESKYCAYETDPTIPKKSISAQHIWKLICSSHIETGTPYILFKDSVNKKNNQANLGTIKSSNLCTEIMEYTSSDETAVCNLASICLSKFIKSIDGKLQYDYEYLHKVTQVVCKNLNKVIDITYYPIPEAERSNSKHRPIGIGVQGLADVFFKLSLPYDSEEARQINRNIFETIYHGALTQSNKLAKKYGTYASYDGSPASSGKLQFDLWLEHEMEKFTPILQDRVKNNSLHSGMWDWEELKSNISQHGLRNSLFVSPMPTASTAQIMGNTESFEPLTSNLYTRNVSSGHFTVVNRYLIEDLIKINMWNKETYYTIAQDNGSVQRLNIPDKLKLIYRTIWEIPQKSIIDMAADRAIYIDQSQSMNLYMADPNYSKLTSMLFHAWNMGLKTGMYYLRSRPAADAIKITLDKPKEEIVCPLNVTGDDVCEMCQ